jgi:hypothetical protein
MLSRRMTYAECRAVGESGTRIREEQECGRE